MDLSDVLRDVQALFAGPTREGKWVLHVQPCTQPARVWGDAVLLSLIFLNLFRNAIQSKEPHLPVQVTIGWGGSLAQVVVRIHDNGPGFAPDVLDRLGKVRLTTKTEGLGVGLALSRRIAEQHGGTLHFKNDSVGRGAMAELTLPRLSTAHLGLSPGLT